MGRARYPLIREFPDALYRRIGQEGMLFRPREEIHRLMRPVRPPAAPLWHRILLPPDDLAAEQPSVVAHADDHAIGQREQVAVGQPRRVGPAEVCLPLGPRLDVRGVVRDESCLVGPERTVAGIAWAPVARGGVGVA